MTVVWQDPPPLGRPMSAEGKATLEAVKANPGRWAVWPNKGTPSRLHTDHGLEVTSRKCPDGVTRTFVRMPPVKLAVVPDPSLPIGEEVLRCETCHREFDVEDVKRLVTHVASEHNRKPSALERTPTKRRSAS